MLQFNVKSNIDQVIRQLEEAFEKQVPFATAKALTDTAKDVQKAVTAEIDKVFDRPTPFTQRAVGISYASKQTLKSKVFIKDVQAAYLGLQIAGGERTPKGRALVIPGQTMELNQYGNMPRGAIKKLLARPDVFSGKVRGISGIWQRTPKGTKLLVLYEPRAQYRRRFPFADIAQREIERSLLPNFRRALADALASAR